MSRDDLFSLAAAPSPGNAEAAPSSQAPETPPSPAPLAARMRPRTLDEFAGQQHILAPGQLLRRAIEADRIQSLIFYGPPGTGKTSLAQLIAAQTRNRFERLSGVESNVADMRVVLAAAANPLFLVDAITFTSGHRCAAATLPSLEALSTTTMS